MKKILSFLGCSVVLLFATDKEKIDSLTNFNKFKDYRIEFHKDVHNSREMKIGKSKVTNGVLVRKVKAILFFGDEGVLEKLTKSKIDKLPNSPYKFLLLDNYASLNATDFDRDMAHLYQSGELRDFMRKRVQKYGQKYFQILRKLDNEKIIAAVKYDDSDNKIAIFCESRQYKGNNPYSKYDPIVITKENSKWVRANETIPSITMKAIYIWLATAYRKQKEGKSLKSGADENATFFDAFKEIKK